ncbi:hypothetical protein [Streptomyces colonosanans]|uniref:hypothetical protein n=1 Tax=Streptomyces colonosanans TaxID=1428652 RepID=UPI0015A6438B|nr:hypothetical protein [Streptomyces colonosanans]
MRQGQRLPERGRARGGRLDDEALVFIAEQAREQRERMAGVLGDGGQRKPV